MLLERYACPLCRKNNHAFHTCHALRTTYSISLKQQQTQDSTSDNVQSSNPPAPTPQPVMANRAATSVHVLSDEPERYEGYESIMAPPPESDSDETSASDNIHTLDHSLRVSKLNENSTNYLNSFNKFTYNVGSVRQSTLQFSKQNCYRISSTATNEYPIIIDSGATHHMWTNSKAFITFRPMCDCYVTLANNYKIPIQGIGTIQINIQGYILNIHDVYLVPSLQFSLYSVKQHRRYLQCSCIFNNDAATLHFPKFKFNIDDDYDMLIYGRFHNPNKSKIHWSSKDGLRTSIRRATTTTPIIMPDHKPNPNKQVHRKMTNIDIHKYMGFRTLKTLEPYSFSKYSVICKCRRNPTNPWRFSDHPKTQEQQTCSSQT